MLVHSGMVRLTLRREASDTSPMSLPGIQSASLSLSQSQAQWDAIISIKATSPFGADLDSRTTSAAATLDAMLPGGYGTSANLSPGAGQQESLAAVTERVRAAQQSTIDLYA